jgi:hypothetical protein
VRGLSEARLKIADESEGPRTMAEQARGLCGMRKELGADSEFSNKAGKSRFDRLTVTLHLSLYKPSMSQPAQEAIDMEDRLRDRMDTSTLNPTPISPH